MLHGYGTFEKETKSNTSDRKIYITSTTMNILKQYKKEQLELQLKLGNKWQGSKRVFTTDSGADAHPNTPSKILDIIINRYNKTASDDRKLPRINFHGLRHTSISLQIASGVQSQIISKRAGHSNIAITHSIYSHFFDSGFKEVANKMDSFLNTGNA